MRRDVLRETSGWVISALLSIALVAQVASTARAELLFRDGDSVVVALLVRSVTEGQGLDWNMSSVLFLPEALVFAGIWMLCRMLSLGPDAALAVNACVNVIALYGAVRLVAGRRREDAGERPRTAPVAWSLGAVVAFIALVLTETSASRDGLELASLLLTTTYYSATVVAMLVTIGLVRRFFDGGRRLPLLIALGAVAAVSTLSNPLFLAWTTLPVGALLAIAAAYPRTRPDAVRLGAWLGGGTILGLLGRIPLGAWIGESGAGYIRPDQWPQSLAFYADLLGDRMTAPWGVAAAAVLIALLVLGVHRTLRARDVGSRLVAASSWVVPLAVTVGAIGVGTHAARYLEPVVFAALLALVASPQVPARLRDASATTTTRIAAVGALLAVVAAGVSIPRWAYTVGAPDADLACVTAWIDGAEDADGTPATGAGQFWTIRAPKLHLDDPAQLVQVDHTLRSYPWLANRADDDIDGVSFLVDDAQTQAWQLPPDARPTDIVPCGRYTIYDFAPSVFQIGPPRG